MAHRMCLATMSMSTSTRPGVSAVGGQDISRDRMSNSIRNESPHVLFTQLMGAPTKVNWKIQGLDQYECLNDNKEAGIAYDPTAFEEIKRILSPEREKISPEFKDNSRLYVVNLRHKHSGLRLLSCSFHGRWKKDNEDGPGRMATEQKISRLGDLMLFVQRMRGAYIGKYDVIVVCGNLNLETRHVATVLEGYNAAPGVNWQIEIPASEHFGCLISQGFENLQVDTFEEDYEHDGNENNAPGYLHHNTVYSDIKFSLPLDDTSSIDSQDIDDI